MLMLLFQVALVGRDEILVVHAARDAAREATRQPRPGAHRRGGRDARSSRRDRPDRAARPRRRAGRGRDHLRRAHRPPAGRRARSRPHLARRLRDAGRDTVSRESRETTRGNVSVLVTAVVVVAMLLCDRGRPARRRGRREVAGEQRGRRGRARRGRRARARASSPATACAIRAAHRGRQRRAAADVSTCGRRGRDRGGRRSATPARRSRRSLTRDVGR